MFLFLFTFQQVTFFQRPIFSFIYNFFESEWNYKKNVLAKVVIENWLAASIKRFTIV